MNEDRRDRDDLEARLRASEERLRLAETAGGIATFELDLSTNEWEWTPQIAALFGFDPRTPKPSLADWERAIFVDDLLKLRGAIEAATTTGTFRVEIRVKHSDGSVHWLAGKGEIVPDKGQPARWLRGAYYEITDRKVLEARLLALNETLEARVAEVRDEALTLEILNRTGVALAADLDLEGRVQTVIDAGRQLTEAQFGAFFFNATDQTGETYSLYTVSGAPREAFANFPRPRNTTLFEPTFRGRGPVRSYDILTRSPVWAKSAIPWYAAGSSANSQLFGAPRAVAVGGSAWRTILRSFRTRGLYGTCRAHHDRRSCSSCCCHRKCKSLPD